MLDRTPQKLTLTPSPTPGRPVWKLSVKNPAINNIFGQNLDHTSCVSYPGTYFFGVVAKLNTVHLFCLLASHATASVIVLSSFPPLKVGGNALLGVFVIPGDPESFFATGALSPTICLCSYRARSMVHGTTAVVL